MMVNRYKLLFLLLCVALSLSALQLVRIRTALNAREVSTTAMDNDPVMEVPFVVAEAPPLRRELPASVTTVTDNTQTDNTQPLAPAKIAPRDASSILRIQVTGIRPQKGQIRIAVFDGAAEFPDHSKARSVKAVPANAAKIQAVMSELPAGVYAVALFHDLNQDGVLNKSAFGIPNEPYGFSNEARGKFGPPKFSAAAFRTTAGETSLKVTLK